MVIMDNYFPQEKCRELWLKIEQLHLSYLEMEESTEKFMHRTKLEECIADFLHLAEHGEKFVFTETEDVLYRSAAFKKDFSGYKATTGWNSLQIYAANLLTQPWRREYRQIKTFCGFYKHQIEANLVGAETMFEVMGYKHIGNGILILEGPICPDRVSNISRDCIVAYVECQILKHIWEEIPPVLNLSWLDILEYRVNHRGSPEQCVNNITYKYTSKQYQPPTHSSRAESYGNRHQPTTPTSQISMSNSHVALPNSHNYAALASHNHVALPPVVIPAVPYCGPRINGCPSTYAHCGYGTYSSHAPMLKQPLPAATTNGLYYPNGVPLVPSIYPVPTGELIAFDSRNGHDVVDETSISRRRRSRAETNGYTEGERTAKGDDLYKNEVSAGQDDKQEVEEDWDYVYRNLERQGYSKDLGERGDVLGLTVSDRQRKTSKESKKVKTTNLDEAMNSISVSDRPLKMAEALEQMEKKTGERTVSSKERKLSQGSSYENVSSELVKQHTKPTVRLVQSTTPVQAKSPKEIVDVDPPKNNASAEAKKTKDKEKVPSSKWECKSCTFFNDNTKEICAMCSKSRHIGKDTPMEVGGPECSTCTLVNPRSAKSCEACGSSLKNSPTYI